MVDDGEWSLKGVTISHWLPIITSYDSYLFQSVDLVQQTTGSGEQFVGGSDNLTGVVLQCDETVGDDVLATDQLQSNAIQHGE